MGRLVSQAKTGQGAGISGSFDTRRWALALIANVYNLSTSLLGTAALSLICAPLCYATHRLNMLSLKFGLRSVQQPLIDSYN